jgi:sugar phosphate isomerase/epimerase
MRLASLPGAPHLTYCTNIHAGESWPDIRASLESFLPAIKADVSPGAPMGVGLRLSGIAADALAASDTLAELKAFLDREGLYVFTLNAFPYGPFHGTRVKEEVYQPDWTTPERLRFTNLAADIQARLLPDGMEGSVSTVPGTFKPLATPGAVDRIADAMLRHCAHLVELERRTGKRITLAVEPEPYCFLETIEETIAFWQERLLSAAAASGLGEEAVRRHLGVCYDVCHAAVEYEDPIGSLKALAAAGIRVTKLQLSAAIRVPVVDGTTEALLRPFDVGVYLHQTIERRDGRLTRHPDLGPAFEALRAGRAGGEWRVHCHVPVFLDRYGELRSTQDFLAEILAWCRQYHVSDHLEAETYTWDVLPAEHKGASKAGAIARELLWVREQLQA